MSAEIDLQRVVCSLDELPDPGAHEFCLGSGDWPLRGFVVRRGDLLRAYVNHCPHAGFPLNWTPNGFLAPNEALIMCSMHGALFEIDSGLCVAGPCEGLRLRAVPVRTESGYVLISPDVPIEEPADLGH